MGEPTVLDLWVCPECSAAHHVAGNQASWSVGFSPWCADGCHKRPVRMVRRRALVLDDAAVEAGSQELSGYTPGYDHRSLARAVLGMEESDGDV